MKRNTIYAALCGIAFTVCTPCQGQTQETNDSTDMFWRHLQLNEVVVTGVTGDTKLKHTPSAVSLLRSMKGFNSGGDFYEGVEVEETFERDFRPLAEDGRLMPVALIVLLNLYVHLTPATMVSQTPEVQAMAKLLRIPVALVIEVLEIYQQCDPQLNRREESFSPLLLPCQQVWQRYGDDPLTLEDYATQLTAYYQ